MEQAAALIHKYVPPSADADPESKGRRQDEGSLRRSRESARRVPRLRAAVDLLAIEVDAKALLLSALNVATYLEKKEDAVTLDVRFGTLTDGTGYSARTTFDAKAKNITVVVENSGHRPLAQ